MTTPIAIGPPLARQIDVVRRAGLSVMLRGPHGIGKSEFLLDYARSRGMRPHVLDLSLMEPADLTGMPYLKTGIDGQKATAFAPPVTLPPTVGAGPSALIIEELNRCDRSLRQPCLQLISARHLNSYRLPDDCFVVACVNPDDGEYEVDPLDPALLSRFVRFDVRPDREAWLSWARGAGLHSGVCQFLDRQPAAFDKATPRTWEQAARICREALETGWALAELTTLLSWIMPANAAQALVWSMREDAGLQLIPPTRLIADPLSYADTFDQWKDGGRLDLMRATLAGLNTHLRQQGLPDSEAIDCLEMLLNDYVPPDLRGDTLGLLGAA